MLSRNLLVPHTKHSLFLCGLGSKSQFHVEYIDYVFANPLLVTCC